MSQRDPRVPAPPDLERALSSPDSEERRRAVSQLPGLAIETAAPRVLAALGDEDWRVRKEATFAARAFLPSEVLLLALIEALRTADVGLCNAAVEVLGAAGAAATPHLEAALPGLDPDGRKLAVEALGRTRDDRALAPLELALADADPNVRQAAAESIAALSSVSPETVERVLLSLLGDADPIVRLSALSGLDALGAAIPWERLAPLLDDPTLRPLALAAVARAGHAGAPAVLARALGSSSGRTFEAALSAFGQQAFDPLPDPALDVLRAASPGVLDRLLAVAVSEESDASDRRSTALLVGAALGDERMIGVALAALGAPGLADAAQLALERLGAPAVAAVVSRLAGEVDDEARTLLVDALAGVAENVASSRAPVLGALRRAAHGRAPRTAARALYALGSLGEAEDLALAETVFLSAEGAVAYAAESALGALACRHSAAARALAADAESAPSRARAAAVMLGALAEAHALGEGEPGALRFLSQAAVSDDAATRRASVAALARLGGRSAVEVLMYALADEEREVRRTAARGLGRLAATGDDARLLGVVRASGDPELLAAAVRAAGDVLGAGEPPWAGLDGGRPLPAHPGGSTSQHLAFTGAGPGMTAAQTPSISGSSSLGPGRRPSVRPAEGPPSSSSRPPPPSDHLVAALASLCEDASADVATAALDALRRAPAASPGRLEAMARALEHPDVDVVKTALLKLASAVATDPDTSPESSDVPSDVRQSLPGDVPSDRQSLPRGAWEAVRKCLHHDLAELRSLAAESICVIDPVRGREALVERASVERDTEVLAAIDAALSAAQRQKKGAGPP